LHFTGKKLHFTGKKLHFTGKKLHLDRERLIKSMLCGYRKIFKNIKTKTTTREKTKSCRFFEKIIKK